MLRYENEGTTISVKLPRTDYTAFLTTKFKGKKICIHQNCIL